MTPAAVSARTPPLGLQPRLKPASWVLLPQQPAGLDIEDPDPHHGAGQARIHLAHVYDFLVVGRPVDDPAAGGGEGGDPGAGPRLRFRLVTGGCPRNPN